MRIGLIALLHESNTFIQQATEFANFEQHVLRTGQEMIDWFADAPHEVGGFISGLRAAQAQGHTLEIVPLLAARAVPSGTVSAAAFDRLLEMLDQQVTAAGSLDGLLVAPHGATVAANHPDADGYWLSQVRKRVGPAVPIVGTLDAHANLSPQMVEACNALVAYRTNPHLDQKQRGEEAARLLVDTLNGHITPTMAAVFPPLAINIERQHTGEPHCRPIYELADAQLEQPGVVSNSILLGFPYADVAELGSAALVVTDNDPGSAERLARELGRCLWQHRAGFEGQFLEIDEALEQAARHEGPVCLLDMGDNVGGGSAADGTWLLHGLQELDHPLAAVACLCDPQAAQQAREAGVGASLRLQIGGKTDSFHGPPLEDTFTVVSLHDGTFQEPEPRHGGFTEYDQGPTAVVRNQRQLTVLLNSRRTPPFSLHQLTSCGLEPADYRVLIAKGVNAPVAAYQPVCSHLLRVNTLGVTTADMSKLEYHHRRRPLFPLEREFDDGPHEIARGASMVRP